MNLSWEYQKYSMEQSLSRRCSKNLDKVKSKTIITMIEPLHSQEDSKRSFRVGHNHNIKVELVVIKVVIKSFKATNNPNIKVVSTYQL